MGVPTEYDRHTILDGLVQVQWERVRFRVRMGDKVRSWTKMSRISGSEKGEGNDSGGVQGIKGG